MKGNSTRTLDFQKRFAQLPDEKEPYSHIVDEKVSRHMSRSTDFVLHLPEAWITKVCRLPKYAVVTALLCWRGHSTAKGGIFTINPVLRQQYGMSRKAIYQGLLLLERKGIVALEKHGKKSTRIRVVHAR